MATNDAAVHLAHCNQGECEGVCKYGDENCPALIPLKQTEARRERALDALNERCVKATERDEKLNDRLGIADEMFGYYMNNDERLRFSQGFIMGWVACLRAFEESFGLK